MTSLDTFYILSGNQVHDMLQTVFHQKTDLQLIGQETVKFRNLGNLGNLGSGNEI